MRGQGGVGELCLVAGEGEEAELAKLEGLRGVQGRQVRSREVGAVEAVAEELEVRVPGLELIVAGEGGDVRRVEQLGEDIGVWGGGRAADKVGGCAR